MAVETTGATIEEIPNDDGVVEEVDSDDENVATGDNVEGEPTRGKGRQNRSEKKARKAIQKLGMKPYPGVKRVTVKKNKDILFIIAQPDVLKSPTADTFVIFGEAKVEDLSQQAAAQAARQFSASNEGAAEPALAAGAADEADAGGDVDETGVSPKDIDLVMAQSECTRAEAVESLKKNNGDIVNAIMELTMDG